MGICTSQRNVDNHILNKYDLLEKLGSGTFAVVRRAVNKKNPNDEKALKIVSLKGLKSEEVKALENEVAILNAVEHIHVVHLYDSYQSNTTLYLLQDLLTGGELFDRIIEEKSFSEAKAAKVILQVCSALVYLHNLNIVHRDLKPENLLLTTSADDYDVKIIDFGLAKKSDLPMDMPCGTPGYVAPEILKKRKYHKQVDVWSLGVITYILLCGFPPFVDNGGDLKKLYKQIKAARYSFPQKYWGKISKDAIDLIKGMLNPKPKKRLTANQVLQSSWIQGNAPIEELDSSGVQRLRRTQLVQKLRRGVRCVLALKRLVHILEEDEARN